MEASGTGNMKFTLNGALTIGHARRRHVEIATAVGAPTTSSLFGLTAEQVTQARPATAVGRAGRQRAGRVFVELIGEAASSRPASAPLYAPWSTNPPAPRSVPRARRLPRLRDCQRLVEARWQKPASWVRSSILNTARAGRFSSDRAVREYARTIWNVAPVPSGQSVDDTSSASRDIQPNRRVPSAARI